MFAFLKTDLTAVAIVATTLCIVIGGILATAAHGVTIDGMFWMMIVMPYSLPSNIRLLVVLSASAQEANTPLLQHQHLKQQTNVLLNNVAQSLFSSQTSHYPLAVPSQSVYSSSSSVQQGNKIFPPYGVSASESDVSGH